MKTIGTVLLYFTIATLNLGYGTALLCNYLLGLPWYNLVVACTNFIASIWLFYEMTMLIVKFNARLRKGH